MTVPDDTGRDSSSAQAARSQLDPAGTQIEQAWHDAARADGADPGEPPMFAHPQWTVGVVLILAAVTLFLGVFGHPLWLLFGAPFILTLVVYIVVRSVELHRRRRREGGQR